jgi:ubiquinone/menaquinone biosynthesis C-methylase UbiE
MPEPPPSPARPDTLGNSDPRRSGRSGIPGRAAASVLAALLRPAFHLLYHQLAFTYDLVAWIVSAGEWADWRRCVLPHLLPGPVLEVAHGTGTLSLDMTDAGYAVAAIDLSPAMGKIASRKKRKRLERNPSAGGPALVRADVRRLPFRSGYFSSATATFPAEFLFQAEAMREVRRALTPGGRWIILPTAFPEWLAKRFLRKDGPASPAPVWSAITDPLAAAGFAVRTEIVKRKRSRVVLILAEKPISSNK